MPLSRLPLYSCLAAFLLLGAIVISQWSASVSDSTPSVVAVVETAHVAELPILELPTDAPSLGEWMTAFDSVPEANRAASLPLGVAVAQARAERLRELIQSDPDAALEEVLTLAEYVQLPEALRPYVETPVSGYGDIDLQWGTTHVSHDDSLQCSHENRLYLAGSSYTLYGAGRREAQSPALNVPVMAYILEDMALVAKSSVLPLDGIEILAAQELFESAEQAGIDLVTEEPVDVDVGALIGGKIYRFASAEVRDQVSADIESAELAVVDSKNHTVELPYTWLAGDVGGDTQGIAESSFFADDDISVLFIRCDFSDFIGEPVSKSDLEADLATVSGYLNEMSYGIASLTSTVTTTLYRPDATGASFAVAGDNDGLHAAVVAKYDAAPDALASSAYDVVAIYFPDLDGVTNSQITYGGFASVGGSKHWINGLSTSSSRVSVITHEFGHNYGLFHSNYWHPEKELSGDYYSTPSYSLEYGDVFDRMGSGSLPEAHFNQFQKHRIDWLPDDKVGTVTTSGTYKIYRFDHIDALDNPLHVLKVQMQDDVFYWVGFRQLYTSNANLTSGAYVVAEGLYNNRPNLIDMTPDSEAFESSDRADAGLPVGSSFNDADAGVTFTSMSVGTDGAGDEWLTVKVDFESRLGIVQDTYEAYENAGTINVSVRRLYPDAGPTSLNYTTADGSATAGEDYVAKSGTLFWAAGDDTSQQISITLNTDQLIEGTEDFSVILSDPTPGVLINGEETVTVSILDYVSEFATVADAYEYDEASGLAFVTVQRLQSSIGAVSVDYATSDGTATAGADYNATTGTIVWADGDASDKQIAVTIKPDALVEGIEDFTVTLSNPAGGVLVSGGITETVSILDPGERYSSFTPSFFNQAVNAIGFQSDGRAIIGGIIGHTSGDFAGAGNIARLNSKGDVDADFNLGGTGFNGEVNEILVLSDDTIIVAGEFTEYNGVAVNRLVRLDADGGLDASFTANIGTGPSASVLALALQANGQVLVGGNFGTFNSVAVMGLIRLNANGTVGDSLALPFNAGFSVTIRDVLVQLDGKIMVIGTFYINWTGSGFRSGVARLDTDGSRDATFDPDAGLHLLGNVSSLRNGYSVAQLPDGDYILGGWFTAYDETAAPYFVRINHDGSFDRVLGSAFDNTVHALLIEPFGAGLVGGFFSAPEFRMLRIQSDWSLDGDFFNSGGPSGTVYAMAYAPDGSLWVGGNFFSYNGSTSRPIVRLASGVSPYDFWAAEYFTPAEIAAGTADADVDGDGDGIVNLGEMALGTNPTLADASSLFGSGNAGGLDLVSISDSQYLQMTLDKGALSGGVWYCVQVSSDLTNWSPSPAVPGDESAFDILEDSASRLVIRDKTPVSAGTPRFVRIVLKTPE